jgi:hypothetical protein
VPTPDNGVGLWGFRTVKAPKMAKGWHQVEITPDGVYTPLAVSVDERRWGVLGDLLCRLYGSQVNGEG